jgi:hypothetical protein
VSDKDIIIRVGLSKKVGQPNFGSFGAEMGMEIHVDLGVLSDPDRFSGLVTSAYQQCMNHITQQLTANAGQPATSVHVPPPRPLSPAPAPSPPAPANGQTSPFGAWIKSQAEQYGIPLPILVGQLYNEVIPLGEATEYTMQGKELASVWAISGNNAQKMFGAWLTQVFDSIDK